MYLPFVCDGCNKDKWSVIYNTESKGHVLQCANCGKRIVLEDVFGSKKVTQPKKKMEAVKQSNGVSPNVEVQ